VRPGSFDELVWGLGWKPETLLAMLWHYIDESGEHGTDGSLIRLTLGGGIARTEQWQALDGPWRRALADAGITTAFHMSDFEAWEPPFDFTLRDGSRDRETHDRLLNELLDTIIAHIDHLVGFVADAPKARSKKLIFTKTYAATVARAIRSSLMDSRQFDEPITTVFADHKNFKGSRIAEFFAQWHEPERIHFGGIGKPACLPQLQVADIIAYELSRWARDKDKRPEQDRYPLRRLKEAFAKKGNGARFLLTIIP
jgi:hypothetical protein